MHELTRNYFPVGPDGPSDRLQRRVVDKYLKTASTSENAASARGFTLALGYLPGKLLAPKPVVLDSVINCLCKVARHSAKVGNEKDAETRRNALIALKLVCQTVGIDSSLRAKGKANGGSVGLVGLDSKRVAVVFEAFFLGLDDYNMDRRGDVGSWSRIEAMKGLEAITCLVVVQASNNSLPHFFDQAIALRTVGSLLKQLAEKLDNVRVEAGGCLERILGKSEPEIPFIPEKHRLREFLGLQKDNEDHKKGPCTVNCADASVTFPMVANAATLDVYFPFIVAGMVVSVGALTESVAKQSKAALLNLLKQSKGSERITELGNGKFSECWIFCSLVMITLEKATYFICLCHF